MRYISWYVIPPMHAGTHHTPKECIDGPVRASKWHPQRLPCMISDRSQTEAAHQGHDARVLLHGCVARPWEEPARIVNESARLAGLTMAWSMMPQSSRDLSLLFVSTGTAATCGLSHWDAAWSSAGTGQKLKTTKAPAGIASAQWKYGGGGFDNDRNTH